MTRVFRVNMSVWLGPQVRCHFEPINVFAAWRRSLAIP